VRNQPPSATEFSFVANTTGDTFYDIEEFMAHLNKPLPLWEKARYALGRKVRTVRHVPREARYAYQRLRCGISDPDAWSLNYHLARGVVTGTGKLREWANGYPAELSGWDEWEAILVRMQDGFQAWLDEDGHFFDKPEQEAKFNDAMGLFAHWFGALWD
jgi:hypothetical protein